MAKPHDSAAQYGVRPREIADTLGIPVSQLYGERTVPLMRDVPELIRLYAAIDDAQGRQRLMNMARREAARCQASDGSAPSNVSIQRPDSAED